MIVERRRPLIIFIRATQRHRIYVFRVHTFPDVIEITVIHHRISMVCANIKRESKILIYIQCNND